MRSPVTQFCSLAAVLLLAATGCNDSNPVSDTAGAEAEVDGAADASLSDVGGPDTDRSDGGPDTRTDAPRSVDGSDTPRDSGGDLRPDSEPDAAGCEPETESCDGLDNDCDGDVDEGFSVGAACGVGAGLCESVGAIVCRDDGRAACDAIAPPGRPEVCDGFDNDCDGEVDQECGVCGTLDWVANLADLVGDNARVGPTWDGGAVVIAGSRGLGLTPDGAVRGVSDLPFSALAEFGLAERPGGGALGLGFAGESSDQMTLTAFADDASVLWRFDLGLGGASAGALAVDDGSAWVALTAAGPGRGQSTWLVRVDLPRDASEPESGTARVMPGGGPIAEGTVAGLAVAGDSVLLAANDPAVVIALRSDGTLTWTRGLEDVGVTLDGVAVNGARLAVIGTTAGDDADVWLATLDAVDGATAWERVFDWGPSDSAASVAVAEDGHLTAVVNIDDGGDAVVRAFRIEPGPAVETWDAAYRYSRGIDVASGGGALLLAGVYDGPTGARAWVRRFHRPCFAGRATQQVKVFVLSGQSNMDGHGLLATISPELQASFPEVEMFWQRRGVVTPLGPASAAGRLGPEVSFGRDVADAFPNERIMLVKYSVGGTNLYAQWHPGNAADDPGRGPLYLVWQDTIAAALASIEDRGLTPVIAGMAWMQGESDGGSSGVALAYEANLARFIRRTRDDLELAQTVPFAIGRIFAPTVAFRDYIRAEQEAVAGSVHDTSWVDTDDLPLVDSIHYDGPGQITLGRRLAAAVINAPAPVERIDSAPAELSERVAEAADFELMLDLDVPLSAVWHRSEHVPYALDRRSELAAIAFDRVAYLIELGAPDRRTEWVWVSMDAFSDAVDALGVPVDAVWNTEVTGVNLRSNSAALQAVDGAPGRMEFWSHCYTTGANTVYDAFDTPTGADCYGSMQVHVAQPRIEADDELVPAFALNRWANGGTGVDLGVGPWSGLHPDWTFSQSSPGWQTRRVSVFVRPVE